MHRRVVLSFVILFGLAAVAQAVPTITVGPHPLPNTGPAQTDTIVISVAGGDAISGETLTIGIADNGNTNADPADPGEPKIVSVDILTGSIFAANNTGQGNLFDSEQVVQRSTTTSSGTVAATGTLFTIVIDRNGAATGSTWDLSAVFVNLTVLVGGNVNSVYDTTTSVGNPFEGTNGSFQYVPEPSSIVLGLFAAAGLGAVAIRRRRAGA